MVAFFSQLLNYVVLESRVGTSSMVATPKLNALFPSFHVQFICCAEAIHAVTYTL